jgi:hypothetical protein
MRTYTSKQSFDPRQGRGMSVTFGVFFFFLQMFRETASKESVLKATDERPLSLSLARCRGGTATAATTHCSYECADRTWYRKEETFLFFFLITFFACKAAMQAFALALLRLSLAKVLSCVWDQMSRTCMSLFSGFL